MWKAWEMTENFLDFRFQIIYNNDIIEFKKWGGKE
jgi:hypothetical protein